MTVKWHIIGKQFGNCNCDYGCPCQFNAPPTYKYCHGMGAFKIEKGFFADIDMSGVNAVFMGKWPGPIHEGNGEMQIILDSKSSQEQQDAIKSIMYGEHTEPMATAFYMYHSMMSKIHEPLIKDIKITVDIVARKCSLIAEDIIITNVEPIKNPVSKEELKAKIVLPDGIEFKESEMASGTTKAFGAFESIFNNSFSSISELNVTNKGIPS
tara:strand:+ start:1006 stop:1638 length:633 start_codon:yes stop_codon:yes gene_type:complete